MAEAEHQGPECVPPALSPLCLTTTSTHCTTITTTSSTPCTTSTSITHPTALTTSSTTTSSPAASTSGASETSKKRFNIREALSEVKTLMDMRGTGGEALSWEERCHGLHRHYQSLFREYKKQEKKLVECQKKQLEVSQHRDVIQTEYARVNMAKGKLESLCRELQRHSKAVAEESRQRQREDEDRRKEVSAKFQSTINDITHKMQEHHQHNQTLRQENIELMTKLKQISEQYEAREEHCERLLKQKQLELQLLEAKMAQQMVAVVQEKETGLAERQYLLAETVQQQKKCELLTHQELELRGQLAMYSDKFEEFQQTLTKSNHVFSTFKKDTDRMAKTIGSLEKEVALWKARCEKANKILVDASEERAGSERALKTLRTKTEKLERLCRALQAERNTLRAEIRTLKENGRVSSAHQEVGESSNVDEGCSGTEQDSSAHNPPPLKDKIEALTTTDGTTLTTTDGTTLPHPPLEQAGVVSGEQNVVNSVEGVARK